MTDPNTKAQGAGEAERIAYDVHHHWSVGHKDEAIAIISRLLSQPPEASEPDRSGVDRESAAWDWPHANFSTDSDDAVDRAYDASEMVGAFHAGFAHRPPEASVVVLAFAKARAWHHFGIAWDNLEDASRSELIDQTQSFLVAATAPEASEGEAVAWMYKRPESTPIVSDMRWVNPNLRNGWTETPLYAHPPKPTMQEVQADNGLLKNGLEFFYEKAMESAPPKPEASADQLVEARREERDTIVAWLRQESAEMYASMARDPDGELAIMYGQRSLYYNQAAGFIEKGQHLTAALTKEAPEQGEG